MGPAHPNISHPIIPPRARLTDAGAAVPIDVLADLELASHAPSVLAIVGGPGMGKSTALA